MIDRGSSLTTALTAILTPKQTISVIIQQSVVVMKASAGFFSLVSDDGRHLHMMSATGYDENVISRWSPALLTGATPAADAVIRDEAIWLESALALAEQYPAFAVWSPLTESYAFVALPLRVDGRIIGVLGLSFDRDQAFSTHDRAFMLTMAQQCALAYERARLYEAERIARNIAEIAQARLALLASASSALSASLDYETTLRNAALRIVPIVADWCAIDTVEGAGPPRRTFVAHLARAKSKAVRALRCNHLLDPISAKVVGQVLLSGKALLSPQLSPSVMQSLTNSTAALTRLGRLSTVSRMIVPLVVHGQVLGAITCLAAESRRIYTADDLPLAEDLARRIALALDNSRLYHTTQEAERQSRRQVARLQSLVETAQDLAAAALDLPALLAVVLRSIIGVFGDGCIIFRLSADGQDLQPIAIQHVNPSQESLIRQALIDNPLRLDECLSTEDTSTDPDAQIGGQVVGHNYETGEFPLSRLGYRTILVPLRHGIFSGQLMIIRDKHWPKFDANDWLFLQDLAERVALALDNNELHRELAERKEHLSDLVGRLIASQEEERRRVAYEVHDGLAQVAVAAHQHLQAFSRLYHPRSLEGRAALDRVLILAQQTVDEARQVIADLRPTVLDDFGLASALGQQAQSLQQLGWQVTFDENLSHQRLPAPIETALFRVAQEALNNVRKHAQTTIVRITLECDLRQVRLVVQDWGKGFVVHGQAPPIGPGERVGLPGMRERMALIGGQCEIESVLGVGTRVIAEVPLDSGVACETS